MRLKNIDDFYPLSPMQQGMLFHTLYAPGTGVYVEETTCTVQGDLNISAFERAWQQVLDRHPILRTAFLWKNLDAPIQVVHRHVSIPLEQHDWRELASEQQRV